MHGNISDRTAGEKLRDVAIFTILAFLGGIVLLIGIGSFLQRKIRGT